MLLHHLSTIFNWSKVRAIGTVEEVIEIISAFPDCNNVVV
jgi:hypothetical protein